MEKRKGGRNMGRGKREGERKQLKREIGKNREKGKKENWEKEVEQ